MVKSIKLTLCKNPRCEGSSKFIFELIDSSDSGWIVQSWISSRDNVFERAYFIVRPDGVCRLNPEMARMVVARVLTQGA